MKLWSWSNVFFLLSLLFLWGCGYWVWWQTMQTQQQQVIEQLANQLERGNGLLSDWQRSNALHLSYLQNSLQDLALQDTTTPLYDPMLALDDKIQHTRWSDPLLGYAMLDDAGRAVRLSNSVAGTLYPLTAVDFSQASPFVAPFVLAKQWIAPLQLSFAGQHLVFWFDISSLLQSMRKIPKSAGELLLVNKQGLLVSPSRYQSVLQQRFGLKDASDDTVLQWQLKRPPEDLTRSRQIYDSSAAWPLTTLAQQMAQHAQGYTPLFVSNYLGKPSAAVWRYNEAWQAFVIAEQDLSTLQLQRQQLRRYLLLGLVVLTLVLLVIFYLLQRRVQRLMPAELHTLAAQQMDAPVLHLDDLPDVDIIETDVSVAASSSATEVQFAQALLAAWQAGHSSESLQQATRLWLQQYAVHTNAAPYQLQPRLWLTQFLQQMPLPAKVTVTVDFADDLARWYALPAAPLANLLRALLSSRLQAHDVHAVAIRLLAAEPGALRLELNDDGQQLTTLQWQQVIAPLASDAVLDHWQQVGGTLGLQSDPFSGNSIVITLVATALTDERGQVDLQFVDGAALLLCPKSAVQQHYRRILRQFGVNLVPLHDANELMQWCSAQEAQQLDYLILDDDFVQQDVNLAKQVITIVRRYFPATTMIVLTKQWGLWQAHWQEHALRVLAKPCADFSLAHAIQQPAGMIKLDLPRVQLMMADELWRWQCATWLDVLAYQTVTEQEQADVQIDLVKTVDGHVSALRLRLVATNRCVEYALQDGLAVLSALLFQLLDAKRN